MSEALAEFGAPSFAFKAAGLRFELRKASVGAPDSTVAIMYRRTGDVLHRGSVGVFKDGEWRGGNGKPLDTPGLYWASMVPLNG